MQRYLLLPVIVIYFQGFGQNSSSQTRLITDCKKLINFIYIDNEITKEMLPYGTGFFVAKKIDSLRNIIFLATAKHVLKDMQGTYLKKIYIRYNLKSGNARTSEIRLLFSGLSKNVFFHPDTTVDIALIPLSGDFKQIDFSSLYTTNMLPKSEFEKNEIAEGTDVFFTGLFMNYMGYQKNCPIIRFGKISLIPDESIHFVDAKRDLIILETTSYGGNSGSPVFVVYESNGYTIRKMIGIMTGSFEEFNEIGILTKDIPVSKENSGISVITPSDYLIELLNSFNK